MFKDIVVCNFYVECVTKSSKLFVVVVVVFFFFFLIINYLLIKKKNFEEAKNITLLKATQLHFTLS